MIFKTLKKDKEKKESKSYIAKSLSGIIIILLVKWLWPSLIPFDTFVFWNNKGSIEDWFATGSGFLGWGILLFTMMYFFSRSTINSLEQSRVTTGQLIGGGFLISLRAGFLEEVCFRWLLFLSGIVTVRIVDYVFGGFIFNHGLVYVIHMNILGPIADHMTLGYLHDLLFHPYGWFVGAALISANSFFRDGHSYQGIIGWLDSWFFGMLMFYMLFKYGIVSCIVIHFAFDMMLFLLAALYMSIFKPKYDLF